MPIDVVTFGCRLNSYELEVIKREAGAAGVADAVVVNTCAVTAEAVRQARQAIRRLKRERPDAQYRRHRLRGADQAGRIRRHGGSRARHRQRGKARRARLALPAKRSPSPTSWPCATCVAHSIDCIDGRARAFVQVQNGCDHRCTFCIIPFGRGNSRSLAVSDVVAQVRRLAERGYREVVLTGVDITSYDGGGMRLGALVKRILREVPELARLRLSSIDSVEADADLLDALANEPRLMPHLHLSLQAGDDLILKRMKRRHSREQAVAFCDQVRRLRPDVAFGADIIAGFPTETEAMFARSLDLIDACGLTTLHVFPFSPRPGTPAARMPQLDRAVAKERARRLREKGEVALRAHLAREVGATRRVLTELPALARTEQFTPVRLAAPAAAGEILDLTIADHNGRQLLAA